MKELQIKKEIYESPQIEVIDIEVEQNIMTGSVEIDDVFLFELNDMGGIDW